MKSFSFFSGAYICTDSAAGKSFGTSAIFEIHEKPKCQEKCDLDSSCVAYDFQSGTGRSSCRLYSINEPRFGENHSDRIYCVKYVEGKTIFQKI